MHAASFINQGALLNMLLPKCVCGSGFGTMGYINGVSTIKCEACGIVRQQLRMTEKELGEWYRTEYFKRIYTHTPTHDYEVANTRLDAYRITPGVKLLDVGCGNGSFVLAARDRSIDAWGQDLTQDVSPGVADWVYTGSLESIAFPTEEFDVVVMHDVLEHLVDPKAALLEIKRILKRPGKFILDFPRFWHESGVHHWKWPEHLWMFNEEQLVRLVTDAGFRVTNVNCPIPSKFVVEAERIPETRPSILTPAGIGDAWWVMTKLPGFLKVHGLSMPDVWVQDSGGPKRTQPFLRCLPFIHGAGYKKLSDRSAIFHEAYVENGRTVYPNVCGVDYFIAYNGIMRAGRSLEETDPEYGCAWRPKMHVSKEAQKMRERLSGGGEYMITFFAEAGMYRSWLAQFPQEKIVQALKHLERILNVRIVVIGAPWDRGQVGRPIAQSSETFLDLIGATSFDQMLGAIMGAKAVVGFPAGNTMLGTIFNVPTVLMWNEYFDQRFWKYSCPPDAPYLPVDTRRLEVETLVQAVRRVIDGSYATKSN